MSNANDLEVIQRRLDCRSQLMLDVIPVNATADPKEIKKRRREIRDAHRHCSRFMERMESDTPFQSENEAVMKLAPIAVWFIGAAVRQFAILCIKALWRRWFAHPTTQKRTNE